MFCKYTLLLIFVLKLLHSHNLGVGILSGIFSSEKNEIQKRRMNRTCLEIRYANDLNRISRECGHIFFLLFSKNIRLLDSDISGHFIIKHDHDNNLFVIVTI